MQQIREYKIIEKIGEGGMGVVYKAFDPNLDRSVAIKGIHSTFTSNEDLVARFKQEARLQASLMHPNIVSLYNFFMEGDVYYMVMEYVEGETLAQRIKRVGLIPPHKCIPMFLQMLEGVGYAHQRGVVHRDIKPSNILIDKKDNIKIMDFGIAKLVGDKGLTKTGTKVGTISYMSPEQVMAEKDIDGRSDIFSLGITFFEMLTAQLPYKTDTESDFMLMQQIVNNNLPSVKKYYPYVPDKVDEAVAKATRKDKRERFNDCKEFYDSIKFEEIDENVDFIKKNITIVPSAPKLPDMRGTFDFNTGRSIQVSPRYEIPKEFSKASVGKRVGAYFLDIIFFILPIAFIFLIFASSSNPYRRNENAAVLGIMIIVITIIFFFKDGFRDGKGLGKGIVGLRIIKADGTPIGAGRAFARMLLTALFSTFYGVGFLVDIILVLADNKGLKIADRILKTQVVEETDYGASLIKREENRSNYSTPIFSTKTSGITKGMEVCPFCRELSNRSNSICENCHRMKK